MELVSADRRLLKAFYTQYTAVLLIILTFTIGAFQRTLNAELPTNLEPLWAPRATVGSLSLMNVFTRDGGIDSSDSQLLAVADVLTQHDLNARIVLQVKDLGMNEGSSAVRRSRVRLESLRAFLISKGVPEHALVLATRLSQSLPERVQVEFVEADG